jgi:hypothetical protein
VVTQAGGAQATATVVIPAGLNQSPTTVATGGVAFRPLAAGSASVSATIPGFRVIPTASRSLTINP